MTPERTTSMVASTTETLTALGEEDFANMSDSELSRLRKHMKELEGCVEDTRKAADSEVKSRVEEGESLCGLTHIQSHRKFVTADTTSIIMSAVAQGIDYTQFVDINVPDLAEIDAEVAEIERNEYSYIR